MNLYFMQVLRGSRSQLMSSYGWFVNLTDQQESEVLAQISSTNEYVDQSKVSFEEEDPIEVALPVTGTVKGRFILHYNY